MRHRSSPPFMSAIAELTRVAHGCISITRPEPIARIDGDKRPNDCGHRPCLPRRAPAPDGNVIAVVGRKVVCIIPERPEETAKASRIGI